MGIELLQCGRQVLYQDSKIRSRGELFTTRNVNCSSSSTNYSTYFDYGSIGANDSDPDLIYT